MRELGSLSWLILFLVFSPLHAFAMDEGFWQENTLPKSPANFRSATHAAVQLRRGFNGFCAGVLISPKGYVLTAAHCVQTCLSSSGHFPATPLTQQITAYRSDLNGHEASECPGVTASVNVLMGRQEIHTEISQAKVLYAGGFVNHLPFDGQIFSSDQLAIAKSLFGSDFAILKFEVPEHLKLSCISPSTRTLSESDALWTIGYPDHNLRSSGHQSEGYFNQYVSYGKAVSVTQSDYLNTLENSTATEQVKTIISDPRIILSDMDIYTGDSGGAILDANGQLVGETTFLLRDAQHDGKTNYTAGTAIGISLESIFAELRLTGNDSLIAEAFHCQQK